MIWLSLVGCVQEVTTEGGQLRVAAPDLKALGSRDIAAPLLAGTRTCPELTCARDCPLVEDAVDCFAPIGSGSATVDAGCWEFDAPGAASIVFQAVPCTANAEGYVPDDDLLEIEVLAATGLTVSPTDFEAIAELTLDPGPAGAFPADWRQLPGESWGIVSGSPFSFYPALWTVGGREVGWTLADAVAVATTSAGSTPVVTVEAGVVTVEVTDDTAADLVFGIADDRWPLASVYGVPAAEVVSLEVVVGYLVDEEAGTSAPFAARALARSADGTLVWGAPVVWTLDEGVLALGDPTITLPGADYTTVADACVLPSLNAGPHEAVLRASFGGLTATATLAWVVAPGLSNDGFIPSPLCREGEPPETEPPVDTGDPPTNPDTNEVPDTQDSSPTVISVEGGCGCGTDGGNGTWIAAALVVGVRRRAWRRGR